jgi:hypothetical protein
MPVLSITLRFTYNASTSVKWTMSICIALIKLLSIIK